MELAARFIGERDDATYCPAGYFPLAVCGAHLSGQPLNYQLLEAGAFLIEDCRTSPDYRLYALHHTAPGKPGLVQVAEGGSSIEVEVWVAPETAFRPVHRRRAGTACDRFVQLAIRENREVICVRSVGAVRGRRHYRAWRLATVSGAWLTSQGLRP